MKFVAVCSALYVATAQSTAGCGAPPGSLSKSPFPWKASNWTGTNTNRTEALNQRLMSMKDTQAAVKNDTLVLKCALEKFKGNSLLGQFQQFWIDALLMNREQRFTSVLQPEIAAFQSRLEALDPEDSVSFDQDSDSIRGASIRALSTACQISWTFPWKAQGWNANDSDLAENILKLVRKRSGVVNTTLERLEKEIKFLQCSKTATTNDFEMFWIGQSLYNRATRLGIFKEEQKRLEGLQIAASTAEDVAEALLAKLGEFNQPQSSKNNLLLSNFAQRRGRKQRVRRSGPKQRRSRKGRSRKHSRD